MAKAWTKPRPLKVQFGGSNLVSFDQFWIQPRGKIVKLRCPLACVGKRGRNLEIWQMLSLLGVALNQCLFVCGGFYNLGWWCRDLFRDCQCVRYVQTKLPLVVGVVKLSCSMLHWFWISHGKISVGTSRGIHSRVYVWNLVLDLGTSLEFQRCLLTFFPTENLSDLKKISSKCSIQKLFLLIFVAVTLTTFFFNFLNSFWQFHKIFGRQTLFKGKHQLSRILTAVFLTALWKHLARFSTSAFDFTIFATIFYPPIAFIHSRIVDHD